MNPVVQKFMRHAVMVLAGVHLLMPPLLRGEDDAGNQGLSRREKVGLFNAAAVGGVLTYGTLMWNYWEKTPHSQSEGWFGRDTKHGGADKTGHMYTGYVASRICSNIYQGWGYDKADAAGLGAMTSLLFTGAMETGDSFSGFGFSPEDMISNTAGAGLGYLLERYPDLGEFIDYRLEYAPSRITKDPTTDYEHLRYLFAFRLAGFDALKDSPFRYVDLLAGYYTRNYHGDVPQDRRERDVFIGVGLDLAELIPAKKIATIFRYLEVPYTYLEGNRQFR